MSAACRIALGLGRFAVVSAALLAAAGAARAQPGPSAPPTVRIPRVTSPPRLEDYLDGRERVDEVRITGFRQMRPGDGEPATQETTAYLSYDDRALYAIFVCRDREPTKIRARRARREQIFGDDLVAVALDTFHDRRRAYLFVANPLGIQAEGVLIEGQREDWSFDTVWQSRGRLTPDGYVVWMAIPFKSLRFPATSTQSWGLLLGRVLPRTNEQSFWPYVTTRLEGFIQQFAVATGLERISPGRNAQLIPYGASAGARFLDRAAGQYATQIEGRAGLDAKVVVRDALTVDVALNPDFSQVESDEPQVTVNQRFEVFFPEKRPFFLENAGLFTTPLSLFFSRRIVDPQWGGRLTGKVGRWAIGALVMDDRAPARQPAAAALATAPRARAAVVRLERELGPQSRLGVLATERRVGSAWNRLFGVDARLKLGPNWVATGQVVTAAARDPDGLERSSPALRAEIRHGGRHLTAETSYTDLGPDFRSDLGFVPRVDLRRIEELVQYRWRPSGRRLVSFGPSVFALALWDHAGRLQDWRLSPEWGFEWLGETEFELSHTQALERFAGVDFRWQTTRAFFRTAWLRWLVWSTSYSRGTGINFVPAAGLAPFLGDTATFRTSVSLRPTPRLTYDQTLILTRLAARAESAPPGVAAGALILSNQLARARLTYQFTAALSLRTIVDYSAVARDATLVALDPRRRVTADLLVTYQLNPWTALYVGYTDLYENLAPQPEGGLEVTGAPTTSVGRQLFVKASYLIRF